MSIIADTHVHLYPCYDLQKAFSVLRQNLSRQAENGHCLAFLAERHDCHYFARIAGEGAASISPSIKVQSFTEGLLLTEDKQPDLWLFAGRQIISAERIEILGLTTDADIPDGLPVAEVVARVEEVGGIPVLSWAPGKWFFERGKIVQGVLGDAVPGKLLLGDTTLRPIGWREPAIMAAAAAQGYTVVAGSDPLPFRGEEQMLGRYATAWEGDFDQTDPVSTARKLLRQTGTQPERVGRRGNILTTLSRLYGNAQSKKG